jgi:8-oxo-dGTP pyrophosphatase MutT (NUDIX family)
MEMKQSTIVFPRRGRRILLGRKKWRHDGHNFGVGKWNGFGGRRKRHDRTIAATAARELEEESGLIVLPEDLEVVARIKFFEGESPLFDCMVYFARTWHRTERETDEMFPQWFDVDEIPYDKMWADDRLWIPIILEGWKIDAVIRFKPGMEEVASFEYVELNLASNTAGQGLVQDASHNTGQQ